MELEFKGWRRQVTIHKHKVTPVTRGTGAGYFYPVEELKEVKWLAPNTCFGKVNGLGLSGDFLIKCSFSDDELESWLLSYAQRDPKKALKLFGKAQRIALDARDALKKQVDIKNAE